MYKELLSAVAIALTFIAFLPYIRSIHRGITRPHAFSWIIWGSTTFVIFLGQLADKGGTGAWPIGVSGIISIYVAVLAYKNKSDSSVTRVDWLFLITAIASLPIWYLTSDPMWSVVILTTIDVMGFGPTFRKAYFYPFEDKLLFFVLMAVRNLFAIIALEHYSITTVIFPAATGVACILFVIMVIYRRQIYSSLSSSDRQ